MLTVRRLRVAAAAGVLAAAGLAAPAVAAGGGGGKVVCPPGPFGPCKVIATSTQHAGGGPAPSSHGSNQPAGGKRVCRDSSTGTTVPCTMPGFGWWSAPTNCYYALASPQPASSDPAWQGHQPGDGAIYDTYCPDGNGPGEQQATLNGEVWLQNPPPGYGGGALTPYQIALEAVAKLTMQPPELDMDPKPGGTGLVGLPVWLAVRRTAGDWGPQTATATAGAVTVTATATVQQVVWQMGDGNSVTCTGPGTPYSPSDGKRSSPDCGYTYTQTSTTQPGGQYMVTATATWNIHWTGGGQQGDLTRTRISRVRVRIGELQVVN